MSTSMTDPKIRILTRTLISLWNRAMDTEAKPGNEFFVELTQGCYDAIGLEADPRLVIGEVWNEIEREMRSEKAILPEGWLELPMECPECATRASIPILEEDSVERVSRAIENWKPTCRTCNTVFEWDRHEGDLRMFVESVGVRILGRTLPSDGS